MVGGSGGPGGGRGGDTILNIFNGESLPWCLTWYSTIISIAPLASDLFRPYLVVNALYNSAEREAEHAVTCQPETRTKVLQNIRSWADSTTATPMCWLSGPAGTGKTTVAHTIAEEYDKHRRLAATFFFWRTTGDRDDINRVVTTLAWQLAANIPIVKKRMEEALQLNNDSWALFPHLSLEEQLSKLFVGGGPAAKVEPADPNLIVIDGLDECASQDRIVRLINWLRKNRHPFRILLTSRPEPNIKACIASRQDDRPIDVLSLSLTESKDDIRKYFVKEVEKIKRSHSESRRLSDWPPNSDIDKLVDQSEGLFAYAALAVRYIGGHGYPKTLLKNVLKVQVGLDALYSQVIKEASKWSNFDIVMGSLMHLRYSLPIESFSNIVFIVNGQPLEAGDISSALGGCHSILAIPDDDFETITPYHASLRDFLLDQSRSKGLIYTPAMSHAHLMLGCLRAITRAFNEGSQAPEYAVISWHHHACLLLSTPGTHEELGGLKDEAVELIQKIDVKWIKSWMTEALCWAGAEYLTVGLPLQKVTESARCL